MLKFFAPENYYALSAMSERALAYTKESLEHRFLVLYEAEGMKGEIASYLIRSLLSEGCIKYDTVIKKGGDLGPKSILIPGPTGLLTTTTGSLHPENETRLLSIPVNDTPEQTRRILRAMAEDRAPVEMDYTPWHSYQQWLALGPRVVTIPYSGELAEQVFAGAIRLRRDFRKVLTLIRAHALIHQETRERGEDGLILANLDDYAAVRGLVADLVAQAAEKGVSAAVRETVLAVARLQPRYGEGVAQSALAEALNLDKGTVSRRVKAAIADGYLYDEEIKEGRPSRLRVGDPLPEDQPVLPTVEALLQCCSEKGGMRMVPILGTGTDTSQLPVM